MWSLKLLLHFVFDELKLKSIELTNIRRGFQHKTSIKIVKINRLEVFVLLFVRRHENSVTFLVPSRYLLVMYWLNDSLKRYTSYDTRTQYILNSIHSISFSLCVCAFNCVCILWWIKSDLAMFFSIYTYIRCTNNLKEKKCLACEINSWFLRWCQMLAVTNRNWTGLLSCAS